MNSKKTCPKCGSTKTHREKYLDLECLQCESCGYDETAQYEVYPEKKGSQKAKGRYTPYKVGGGKRTIK